MPPKRSKRTAAVKATKCIEKNIAESSEEEQKDTPTNSKLVIKKPKIGDGSRFRYAKDASDKAKLANKGKRNAGKLKQLKDMPLEIFFEVTSWLHPLDLLRLSRASKYFCQMFLSKSSKALWIRARRNLSMPDCPDSITEAQYASLVFESTCQACGVSRAPKIDYGYLVRFCGACYKENVVNGKRLSKLFPKTMDPIIFHLMSCACGDDYSAKGSNPPSLNHNASSNRFYKPQFVAIAERLLTLKHGSPAYTSFINEMSEKATAMNAFNYTVTRWLRDQLRDKAKAEKECMKQRESSIEAKLLEMGYKKEDFPVRYNHEWNSCVNQPRPLTTRIWNQIKGRLVECLEYEKKRNRAQLIAQRKYDLAVKLSPHYIAHVDTLDEDTLKVWFPSLQEAVKLPGVNAILSKNDAQIDLTPERVREILDIVKVDAIATRDRIEVDLLSQLREVYNHDVDGSNVKLPESLDRKYLFYATSLFRCPHYCCRSSYSPLHSYVGILQHIKARVRFTFCVDVAASQIARKVVRLLGFSDDHLAKDLPHGYICNCLHPKIAMPSTFGKLIAHLHKDRVWYNEMKDNLNSNRDSSLVLHDAHDFASPTAFIRIHTPGEAVPTFGPNAWSPKDELAIRTGYGCNECEKLSSVAAKSRWYPVYTFQPDKSNPLGPHIEFIHHVKTKHQHDPREEDVAYLLKRSSMAT